MKKFSVIIEAENAEEAEKIAIDKYKAGEIAGAIIF